MNALFDDRYHWDACEIEHEQLHELKQDVTRYMQQSKVNEEGEEDEGDNMVSSKRK